MWSAGVCMHGVVSITQGANWVPADAFESRVTRLG